MRTKVSTIGLLLVVLVLIGVEGSNFTRLHHARAELTNYGNEIPPAKRRIETLWSHFQGLANGRAFLTDAPQPSLKLAWVLDLSDQNGDGNTGDAFFGDKNQTGAIGIAVRADEHYLYLFNVNFYQIANHIFKVRQRDGQLVATANAGRSESISNRHSFQLIDAPWNERIAFKGTFYEGTKMFRMTDLTGIPDSEVHIKFQGYAQEGQRWGMGKLFLDGRGSLTKGEAPLILLGQHAQTMEARVDPFKKTSRGL